MAELRAFVSKLGFGNVRSLLQSGNLIFVSEGRGSGEIERLLEAEMEKRFAIRTTVFVRTAAEWKAIVAENPFPKEAEHDPGHLVAMVLKNRPAAKQVEALTRAIAGPEVVRMIGSVAYIVYPNGIGRSKLTNALIDRKLETRGTSRNWNTVLKIAAMCAE